MTATLLRLARVDGGELVLDGAALTRAFFMTDPSSVGDDAYDSGAGKGAPDGIEVSDIQALNRTMRARSAHSKWEGVIGGELTWLREIAADLDLIETDDAA